jgi:hypothetical protein
VHAITEDALEDGRLANVRLECEDRRHVICQG